MNNKSDREILIPIIAELELAIDEITQKKQRFSPQEITNLNTALSPLFGLRIALHNTLYHDPSLSRHKNIRKCFRTFPVLQSMLPRHSLLQYKHESTPDLYHLYMQHLVGDGTTTLLHQ